MKHVPQWQSAPFRKPQSPDAPVNALRHSASAAASRPRTLLSHRLFPLEEVYQR